MKSEHSTKLLGKTNLWGQNIISKANMGQCINTKRRGSRCN
jgi:hypothetical protein